MGVWWSEGTEEVDEREELLPEGQNLKGQEERKKGRGEGAEGVEMEECDLNKSVWSLVVPYLLQLAKIGFMFYLIYRFRLLNQ